MNPFTTAFIKAPKKSRHDFDHSNTLGLRFGVLTPTLERFIVPGDEVSISMEQICRLAPMPVPTFTNLKIRHDFFFVPLRLLYGSEYLDQLYGADVTLPRASVNHLMSLNNIINYFAIGIDGGSGDYTKAYNGGDPFVPGSLSDYLRYPVYTDRNGALDSTELNNLAIDLPSFGETFEYTVGSGTKPVKLDVLETREPITVEPYFAYHFIWRDWYRFTGIQNNSIEETYLCNGILSQWNQGGSPICNFSGVGTNNFGIYDITTFFPSMATYIQDSGSGFKMADIGKFHYAHLVKDMFTSVRYGSKPTVLIPTGANGTIPALREASAIQRFLDIISITGQRYFDKVKGLFGVESEGPKDDRVQFLARYQQFIKIGEVLTTATTTQANTGDYAGRGILIDGKYLFKRRFTEHGWLMCISSVIPDVAYSGLPRELTDVHPMDTPLPSLAEIGDQTVFNKEVFFAYGSASGTASINQSSFGDQFRYYAYKSAPSEVHGSFLMDTMRPWSPLIGEDTSKGSTPYSGVINFSKVRPTDWNFIFNDTADEFVFGDRFFLNIDFYEKITRALPKYINYHL